MAANKNLLLVLDGSSLAFRAFYALPLLQTSGGVYTNAVYGFTNMLDRLLEQEQPGYVAAAFDLPAPTFRHREYALYKAQRQKAPDELQEQFEEIHHLLEGYGIPVLQVQGYEADDIIGTLVREGEGRGLECRVVSGDIDTFQLVSPRTRVIYLKRGVTETELVDEPALKERYGIGPNQLPDFKGLKGDASDNIPGVPGIGDKTARSLLENYGSLEEILAHANEIKGKMGERLRENMEQALLSKRLATINRHVPIDLNWQDLRSTEPDYNRLEEIFRRLEMKRMLEKIPARTTARLRDREGIVIVHSDQDRQRVGHLIKQAEAFSFIIDTEPPGSWKGRIKGLASGCLVDGVSYGCYLPAGEEGAGDLLSLLAPLEKRNASYTGKGLKQAINILAVEGRELPEDSFDLALAGYLLDPAQPDYTPPSLAERYLGKSLPAYNAKVAEPAQEEQNRYALAVQVREMFELREKLTQQLVDNCLFDLYQKLERPLVEVLGRMERRGIRVDPARLEEMSREIEAKLKLLEQEVYSLAGEEFNLNSPKQLSHILFEKLKLPVVKKTKTGYSTDARVLEELAPRHEVVAKIVEHRALAKLNNTYLQGLLPLIDPDSGRIYTTFHQTVTATGRLSSSDPNLQNIPVRLPEGRKIRMAFIPGDKNRVLLSADYSQIELRIMAHISADPLLTESFIQGHDVHRRTAAEIFSLPLEEVTQEQRKQAKAVNFGIIYGISDYGLAQNLGIKRDEAAKYIKSYFERYQGVYRYSKEIVRLARETGYVATLLNRRRYLPEINSRSFPRRSFAERTALNTPIQGSAADIIKLAMLRIDRRLRQEYPQALMLLQVHDELIFDLPAKILLPVARLVKEEMEAAYKLNVPLEVDLKTGVNWYSMEDLQV